MIKISYICDTCGAVNSHTFNTWDEAQEYCSKQDRRDHTRNPNYDGTTYGQHAMTYHEIETGGYNDSTNS